MSGRDAAKGVQLELAGWERRTTIDEPRLSELVELYRELGFEVMVRAIDRDELGEACAECYLADPDRYRTIYTRPAGGQGDTMDGPTEGPTR